MQCIDQDMPPDLAALTATGSGATMPWFAMDMVRTAPQDRLVRCFRDRRP